MNKPIYIKGQQELDQVIARHNDLIVLMFTAHWCGPCKQMKEYIHSKMVGNHNFANCLMVFLDIDDDDNEDLSNFYGVESIPTFILGYAKDGKLFKVDSMTGANQSKLETLIRKNLK